MIIADIDAITLRERLTNEGLGLHVGPFVVNLKSRIASVAEGVQRLYSDCRVESPVSFSDIYMELYAPGGLRRFYKPQVMFSNDGHQPFKPLPFSQAFPLFEWSLNWCVATHAHQYTIIHAAVIERGGRVAILPGAPGAGKSTLCAALVNRGWRLFSDEMALISLQDFSVVPIPRPVSLKNASIDIIKRFAPDAVFGEIAADTHKGTVTHMKAPADSVVRGEECGRAAWLIMPRYEADENLYVRSIGKARMFMELAGQTFNYHILGETGFEALSALVDSSDCYRLSYSKLDEAVAFFDQLADTAP